MDSNLCLERFRLEHFLHQREQSAGTGKHLGHDSSGCFADTLVRVEGRGSRIAGCLASAQ